jgi:hypothetical protein
MALEMNFERPEDLVKFIRYHHVSQHGAVATRKLYRSIQGDVAGSAAKAKKYVEDLSKSQDVYLALRDPDNSYWSNSPLRCGTRFTPSGAFNLRRTYPFCLRAFATWTKRDASKLLVKVAAWSIRAQFDGRLGGGVADELFGSTARAILFQRGEESDLRACTPRETNSLGCRIYGCLHQLRRYLDVACEVSSGDAGDCCLQTEPNAT